MLNRLKRTPNPIDTEIEALLKKLGDNRDKPEVYTKIMNELERLQKMKTQNASRRLSPDTVLIVAANLAGIAIIVKHEEFNVITSKAMGFVPKPKV